MASMNELGAPQLSPEVDISGGFHGGLWTFSLGLPEVSRQRPETAEELRGTLGLYWEQWKGP